MSLKIKLILQESFNREPYKMENLSWKKDRIRDDLFAGEIDNEEYIQIIELIEKQESVQEKYESRRNSAIQWYDKMVELTCLDEGIVETSAFDQCAMTCEPKDKYMYTGESICKC
jgi:hypothetical protein